jgi:dethiobiotin synthetase
MPAVFITGTGTGIGKTFVTASLVRHLLRHGHSVHALKPIVSGFDPAQPSGSDPAVLLGALGREVTEMEWDRISPWRFLAPLSPDMAARAENRAIDFESLIQFCRGVSPAHDGFLLIEGVGGVMVPLDERHTVLDWMAGLELPAILVGGAYLGTLSHVLSAQDVLINRKIDLRAIVISETEGSSVPFEATMTSLGNFAAAPLLGLRRQAEPDTAFFEHLMRLI